MRRTIITIEYVVHSKFVELIYANDKHGFGVCNMPASLREVPNIFNSFILSKQQVKQQKVLAPDKVSDKEALKLIVSNLPNLHNDNYQHLID